MSTIQKTILANGVTVRFENASRRYFGDYHHVRVEVICEIPVPDTSGPGTGAATTVGHRSSIERMAVPTAEVAAVIGELVDRFKSTALIYISSPSFPSRYLRSQTSELPVRGNVTYTPGF